MTLAPRSWPQPILDELNPVKPGFPYFEHAAERPFEAAATAMSPVNAWWCADLSLLAYGDEAFGRAAFARSPLPGLGYRLEWGGETTERPFIALHGASATLIAFCGTRLVERHPVPSVRLVMPAMADLWTDVRVNLVSCGAGRAHAGMVSAFMQVRDAVEAVVVQARQAGRSVWLTGHSLGGAIATIARAHYGPEQVHGLYVLGCPPVGDAAFTQALPQQSLFRFVHRDDWTAKIDAIKAIGYVYAGVRHEVPPDPAEREESAVKGALAWFKGVAEHGLLDAGKTRVAPRSAADHAPVYYAVGLWNVLPGVGL